MGNTGIKNIEILSIDRRQYITQILDIIDDLRRNNPTLQPDDIGIMFLENINENYKLANELQAAVGEKFGWDINIVYETKVKRNGAVFVSNKNNVKGLEFPFVICLMQNPLDEDLQNRNSIYMMLTRSFITSYFIIPNEEEVTIKRIKQGVAFVEENGYLHVKEPNQQQKKILNNAIINRNNIYKSHQDIVEEIMDKMRIEKMYRSKLHSIIKSGYKDELDRDRLFEIIRMNYSLMN